MAAEQQTRVKGAGGGNRFAAACGLLRQYQCMMGQGSGRGAAMTTMGLMPGADGVEAAHVTPEERIKNTMELLLFPQRPGTLMENLHQRYALHPSLTCVLGNGWLCPVFRCLQTTDVGLSGVLENLFVFTLAL
jgi:hypothetical protein